jgi:hypothetical protein
LIRTVADFPATLIGLPITTVMVLGYLIKLPLGHTLPAL